MQEDSVPKISPAISTLVNFSFRPETTSQSTETSGNHPDGNLRAEASSPCWPRDHSCAHKFLATPLPLGKSVEILDVPLLPSKKVGETGRNSLAVQVGSGRLRKMHSVLGLSTAPTVSVV